MKNATQDIGIANQIGKYSDAIETQTPGRMLFLSGTPGLTTEGRLPDTFEGRGGASLGQRDGTAENGGHGTGTLGQRLAVFNADGRHSEVPPDSLQMVRRS
jgi:hypothetical protein